MIMRFALVNCKERTEYYKNTYSYLLTQYDLPVCRLNIRNTIFYFTTVCEISTTVHFKVEIKNLNLKYFDLDFFGYCKDKVWRRIQV